MITADIRMRFLGHPWERTTVSADAEGREELFIALFLRAMQTVPELLALPGDLEAYTVRWDGDEVSIYHPDVEQAIFRARPEPERSAQEGAPVRTRPPELWREERGHSFAVPYWQAVWPDRDGAFPTDASCSLSPGTQPLL